MHAAPAPAPAVGHDRARRRAVTAVAVGLAVTTLLGAGVLIGFAPQIRLDVAASTALYAGDDRSPLLDVLLEVLTAPGSAWFRFLVFVPLLAWFALRRAWRIFVWVLAAQALVGLLTMGLKEFIGRARPDFEDGGLTYGGLSYPSGHSSGIAAMVTVGLLLAWPRLAPRVRRIALAAGIVLVLVVGLTRMWLGVHFLSDVVGGWSLGVAWSLAVALVAGGLPGERAALPPRADPPGPS